MAISSINHEVNNNREFLNRKKTIEIECAINYFIRTYIAVTTHMLLNGREKNLYANQKSTKFLLHNTNERQTTILFLVKIYM